MSPLNPGVALTDPRRVLASGGLAAIGIAALGVDGGLVWLVAGVFTARAMTGGPLGGAWGVAVIAAGLRWGTLGLADLEVATRLAGPTLVAGPPLVRLGMGLALAGAIAGEAASDGLRATGTVRRIVSLAAAASLAPLYLLEGPTGPIGVQAAWWAGSGIVLAAAVLIGGRLLERFGWSPLVAQVAPAVAASGLVVAVLSS